MTLETLFPVRYTGSVDGRVYGYTLDGIGNATVFDITSTVTVPLGTTPVAFPHAQSVREFVKGII